jgi:hypothetical protein
LPWYKRGNTGYFEGAILISSRDNEVVDGAARIVTSECRAPANDAQVHDAASI